MGGRLLARLDDCTIASSDQAGSIVTSSDHWFGATALSILTPPELSGNCVLQASPDSGVTWATVSIQGPPGPVDCTLPANRFVTISQPIAVFSYRVYSDSPEVGDRVFQFWCIQDT